MSKQFYIKQISFNVKTVLFQIIQYSISTLFKCKYGLIVNFFILFLAIQFSQRFQFSICMPLDLFKP